MSVKLDTLLNPGTVTDSTECGVANGISAGGCFDEAMEILVRLLLQFLVQVMIQLVQNDLKLHHGTVAVHVLHTGICVLSAPQFSLVSSELHPVAYSVCLPLSPTFSSTVQTRSSSASFCSISN